MTAVVTSLILHGKASCVHQRDAARTRRRIARVAVVIDVTRNNSRPSTLAELLLPRRWLRKSLAK
jgi:hypothetical protein